MNKILDHVHCLDDDGLDKEPWWSWKYTTNLQENTHAKVWFQ